LQCLQSDNEGLRIEKADIKILIENETTEEVDFGKCFLISEPRVYVNMTAHVECERRRQRALE
jgi:hypothetical protein